MTSAPSAETERATLVESIVATAALGILGIAWGLAVGSQMILLDGIYAVIGIATSWLLLKASGLASVGPSRGYPFGREGATPIVIGIQGFVLLATLLYAAVEAAFTIIDGGSTVAPGWAILYSAIVTVACIVVWMRIRRAAGHSDLLVAESIGWRVAAMRGVGMLVGFTILWLVMNSSFASIAPFIDPVMVIVTCVVFVRAPIEMIRTTIVELLEGAPPERVRVPIEQAVDAVVERYDLDPPVVRMTKIGPKVYLQVDGTAGADVTIAQEHEVRVDLQRRLEAMPYDVWLNLELRPR